MHFLRRRTTGSPKQARLAHYPAIQRFSEHRAQLWPASQQSKSNENANSNTKRPAGGVKNGGKKWLVLSVAATAPVALIVVGVAGPVAGVYNVEMK